MYPKKNYSILKTKVLVKPQDDSPDPEPILRPSRCSCNGDPLQSGYNSCFEPIGYRETSALS